MQPSKNGKNLPVSSIHLKWCLKVCHTLICMPGLQIIITAFRLTPSSLQSSKALDIHVCQPDFGNCNLRKIVAQFCDLAKLLNQLCLSNRFGAFNYHKLNTALQRILIRQIEYIAAKGVVLPKGFTFNLSPSLLLFSFFLPPQSFFNLLTEIQAVKRIQSTAPNFVVRWDWIGRWSWLGSGGWVWPALNLYVNKSRGAKAKRQVIAYAGCASSAASHSRLAKLISRRV